MGFNAVAQTVPVEIRGIRETAVRNKIGGDPPSFPSLYDAGSNLMNCDVAYGRRSLKNSCAAMAAHGYILFDAKPDIVGINPIEQGVDNLLSAGRSIDVQRPFPPLPRRRDDDVDKGPDMVDMVMCDEDRANLENINRLRVPLRWYS